MNNFTGNVLYHYTKRLETIISILRHGFYPHTCVEDVSFLLPNYPEAKIAIPMVCFTDIPYEFSEAHRNEYGQFGIGLKKEWGIRNGINPVGYVVPNSSFDISFNNIQKMFANNLGKYSESEQFQILTCVLDFSGHLKLYSSETKGREKLFYDEREWRYLPPFATQEDADRGECNRIVGEKISEESIRDLNRKIQSEHTLKFGIDDIFELIIPESEIENAKYEFIKEFRNYEEYLLKIRR